LGLRALLLQRNSLLKCSALLSKPFDLDLIRCACECPISTVYSRDYEGTLPCLSLRASSTCLCALPSSPSSTVFDFCRSSIPADRTATEISRKEIPAVLLGLDGEEGGDVNGTRCDDFLGLSPPPLVLGPSSALLYNSIGGRSSGARQTGHRRGCVCSAAFRHPRSITCPRKRERLSRQIDYWPPKMTTPLPHCNVPALDICSKHIAQVGMAMRGVTQKLGITSRWAARCYRLPMVAVPCLLCISNSKLGRRGWDGINRTSTRGSSSTAGFLSIS
jgi:hypothetical protein